MSARDWKNFHIWRGKLPHWRADNVVYYVTFRHSRPLDETERGVLLHELVKLHGRGLELLVACVLPDRTEVMFRVLPSPEGDPFELSDLVEKAKSRCGKLIRRRTEERFPPFYGESYDRIVRDEAEFGERWEWIVSSPVREELAESSDLYELLWIIPD